MPVGYGGEDVMVPEPPGETVTVTSIGCTASARVVGRRTTAATQAKAAANCRARRRAHPVVNSGAWVP